jgi:hypothetical protein
MPGIKHHVAHRIEPTSCIGPKVCADKSNRAKRKDSWKTNAPVHWRTGTYWVFGNIWQHIWSIKLMLPWAHKIPGATNDHVWYVRGSVWWKPMACEMCYMYGRFAHIHPQKLAQNEVKEQISPVCPRTSKARNCWSGTRTLKTRLIFCWPTRHCETLGAGWVNSG